MLNRDMASEWQSRLSVGLRSRHHHHHHRDHQDHHGHPSHPSHQHHHHYSDAASIISFTQGIIVHFRSYADVKWCCTLHRSQLEEVFKYLVKGGKSVLLPFPLSLHCFKWFHQGSRLASRFVFLNDVGEVSHNQSFFLIEILRFSNWQLIDVGGCSAIRSRR